MIDSTCKDPFASSKDGNAGAANSTDEVTIYGQAIGKTGTTSQGNSCPYTIGTNIQNPHTFYYYNLSGYGYVPNSTSYRNSWSAKNTDVYNRTKPISVNDVVKTIYDPCPTGYTVPPDNAFATMTANGWQAANKGHLLEGCWFPAVGTRNNSSGVFSNVSVRGYYMQATPGSDGNARFLYLDGNANASIAATAKSYGASVRPVSEDYK